MASVDVNAARLQRELAWFEAVLQARLKLHFGQPCEVSDIREIPPPDLDDDSDYAQAVAECALGFDERLLLLLALVPHVRPQLLDLLWVRNANLDRGFTEFGGWKGRHHGGFLPTCETAVFLIAGEDLQRRFACARLFDEEHCLRRRDWLRLQPVEAEEPALSAPVTMPPEALHRLTTGIPKKPDFGPAFPARRITTPLSWDDLVLSADVLDEIEAIRVWIARSEELLDGWGLRRALKPGYRTLFHGPPGTGKTLTATLLGQGAGVDVYRIDLSMVVSKYIGETEKNLANVFDQAQHRNWILFFDEADALFGKRTEASSSNDRHANQEIAYLLQRVEDYPGTVILATNLEANIDEAFSRRFQSRVYFPMPDAEQRLRLWRGMLSDAARLDADVDVAQLAEEHEIAGGAIANVVRFAALAALRAGRERIARDDLVRGVRKERIKDGWTD